MKSISFPTMFNNTFTHIVEGHNATLQNLKLLLLSDKGSLFGDPYYGTILKKLMFNLNDVILKDIVVDAIYTSILLFMPLIKVKRSDITIALEGTYMSANIKATNMLDFSTDLYNISLMNYLSEE